MSTTKVQSSLEKDLGQTDYEYGGFSFKRIALASFMTAFMIGVLIGLLLYTSTNLKTLLVEDYTHCLKARSNVTCRSELAKQFVSEQHCRCRINFNVEDDQSASQINIYYGFTGLYQNYRFVALSKDGHQLTGKIDSNPSTKCQPFSASHNRTIIPCGALANNMFNDEFKLLYKDNTTINMDRYNIALERSRKYQFTNPSNISVLKNYSKPVRWRNDLLTLDPINTMNNGLENGAFIVWMTLSTFGDFIKLYSIIKPEQETIKRGRYSLDIMYRYGTLEDGESRKYVYIETIGAQGVKNTRLLFSLSFITIVYFVISLTVIFYIRKQ